TLFLFGGVASIRREPRSPGDEVKVAIAGPIMSVVLALCFLAIAIPLPAHMLWGNALFWLLAWSNTVLAVFNLLPAYPSDGGRILRALFWRLSGSQAGATTIAGIASLVVAALLITLGVYLTIAGDNELPRQYVFVRGWWMVLIGLFLGQAALGSLRQARINRVLETMPVSECMAHTLIPVPADTTIAGFVGSLATNGRRSGYPVVAEGAPVGLVTLHDTSAVPVVLWNDTPVTAVMTPSSRAPGIPAETTAMKALTQLDDLCVDELPVIDAGTLVGVVSKESIFSAVRAREKARRP
ncbi:MAG TPA: site-2 protease family protein, partial [Candidatus Eremiobacteraceae bacterium]|nr:site-2 protease family protein [Candidatus Eremiobacteraceae bacterium]